MLVGRSKNINWISVHKVDVKCMTYASALTNDMQCTSVAVVIIQIVQQKKLKLRRDLAVRWTGSSRSQTRTYMLSEIHFASWNHSVLPWRTASVKRPVGLKDSRDDLRHCMTKHFFLITKWTCLSQGMWKSNHPSHPEIIMQMTCILVISLRVFWLR